MEEEVIEENEDWSVTMNIEITLGVCDEPSWESACEYMKRQVLSEKYPFRNYGVDITFS